MKDTTIAVDIAKDVFEIAVSPEPGVVTEKHRLSRKKLLSFFANRPAATVVMEACGSSHHWGREINKLGHRVVLLPPHVVRPYGTKATKPTQRGFWKPIGTKTSNQCR